VRKTLITTIDAPVQAFLDDAEERATLDESALEAFAIEHDLDDEELAALRAELDAREVEIVTPEPEAEPAAPAAVPHEVLGSTDPLTLFMNRAGRYPLLTAAEEVALAKRVERGDAAAKERMINSNLRLVVSIAKRYQGHDLPRSSTGAAATSSRPTPPGGSARPASARSRTSRRRSGCRRTSTSGA